MKLPRTIQLDPSDCFVFDRAAEPGEWAVSGAFRFHGTDAADLAPKARVALRSGFLGVASLGWSTLVEVAEASPEDLAGVITALAAHLRQHFGAPDDATALAAAREEVAFAASLCTPEVGTVLAVHRALSPEGITERFRTLRLRGDAPAPVFALVQTDQAAELPDLRDLLKGVG